MSSPDSEKRAHYSEKIDPRETGTWMAGIRNPELLKLFGEIVSDWVHVEEFMINMLDLLLISDPDYRLAIMKTARGFAPGRQVFRSISSNDVRAKVMRNLLEKYPGNEHKKDPIYKRVLTEFQGLVALRNDYLHGLWWTKSTGDVYLQTENIEHTMFNRKRRVPKKDFESFLERTRRLWRDIEAIELMEHRASAERKEELTKRGTSPPEHR